MTSMTVESPRGTQAHTPEPSKASTLRRVASSKALEASLTFIVFVVLFAIYAIWLGGDFTNAESRLLDVHQNVPVMMLGLAVLVTLIGGQFDLSVASMATLTTFLAIGLVAKDGWPFGLVIAFCLAVGIAGGLLNAIVVEFLKVNAFIATLGTLGMFLGVSRVYSSGAQIVPDPTGGHQLPTWFVDLGSFTTKFPSWILAIAAVLAAVGMVMAAKRLKPAGWDDRRWLVASSAAVVAIAAVLYLGLGLDEWIDKASWMIALLLVVGLAIWLLLQYTTFGRYLKATGSNREAARLAGVKTRRHVMLSFVLGGFLAAMAGVLLAANQGAATPDIAGSYLLPAFAAAFLSTVVFSTGHFTVWGTLIGGIFVVWVSQGLIIGGLDPTWTDVVNGAVLVAAVALSTVMRRRTA
jgi:ribose/xylose/arabinose/galactoside ABC-type transport system permease subunit